MIKDNSKLDVSSFCSWYQLLIDNENVFCLNRNMLKAVKDARVAYDKEMDSWV